MTSAPHTILHDSTLGRWVFSEWQPPHLAAFVERVWYSDGVVTFPRKRLFPTGTLELIVNLGAPIRIVEGAGPELIRTFTFSGLQTRPMVIEMEPHQRALGIRLRPAGAFALLGIPLREISGLTVELDALLGPTATELAERCHRARSAEECLRVAAEWVHRRVMSAHGIEAAIAWTVARLEQSGGTVPIAWLREQTGLSKTRLASSFRDQVGLLPKMYGRILRFRRAQALLHRGPRPLAEVAADAGYYDQPHMNADFRELGGVAPGQFLAAPRYFQTMSVAEH
jgi:AraC-like DNA-binding protein